MMEKLVLSSWWGWETFPCRFVSLEDMINEHLNRISITLAIEFVPVKWIDNWAIHYEVRSTALGIIGEIALNFQSEDRTALSIFYSPPPDLPRRTNDDPFTSIDAADHKEFVRQLREMQNMAFALLVGLLHQDQRIYAMIEKAKGTERDMFWPLIRQMHPITYRQITHEDSTGTADRNESDQTNIRTGRHTGSGTFADSEEFWAIATKLRAEAVAQGEKFGQQEMADKVGLSIHMIKIWAKRARQEHGHEWPPKLKHYT